MKIERIQILLRDGQMDYLIFDTNLPNPAWPFTGNNQLIGYAPKDKGEEYIKEHFPDIPYKIIDGKIGQV